MNNDDIREYMRANILTTSEAAEFLQVSRQRLSAIVKDGEIVPVKHNSQGMLFLRSDIQKYKTKRYVREMNNSLTTFHPIYDASGSTAKSIQFFEENIEQLSCIHSVYVYFDEIDAAFNNFYLCSNQYSTGSLMHVEIPHLVIRDINGKELWLGACNCGYGGEGPHGTKTVLRRLRDGDRLKINYTDEQLEELIYHRVINIYTNESQYADVIFRESVINDNSYNFTARLFSLNNHLVLLQDNSISWDMRDRYSYAVLDKYRAFIPQPIEIIIFPTYQMALDAGYVGFSFKSNVPQAYRVIIRDTSGRELWLNPDINNEKPIHKQDNIREILKACGYDLDDKKNQSTKLKSWINITLRVIKPDLNQSFRFTLYK